MTVEIDDVSWTGAALLHQLVRLSLLSYSNRYVRDVEPLHGMIAHGK